MKIGTFAICLMTVVTGAWVGVAADTGVPAETKQKPSQTSVNDLPDQTTTKVHLTGSYLKQTITRNGRITDGFSQVTVIDRDAIDRSGATTVKQVLVRQGVGR